MQQPAQPPGTTRQVNLELPAGLTAIYSNAVVISQTLSEVVLDFVQVMPNDPRARVLSRIVMTPTAARHDPDGGQVVLAGARHQYHPV